MEPTDNIQPSPANKSRKGLLIVLLVAVLAIASVAAVIIYKNSNEKPVSNTQPSPKIATVRITDTGFEPASLSVDQNTVVIWVNATKDKPVVVAANPYPSDTSVEGLKSQQLSHGASYRYQFKQLGTYNYHDDLNPTINGTIVVQ